VAFRVSHRLSVDPSNNGLEIRAVRGSAFAILSGVMDTQRLSLTPLDRETARAIMDNDRSGRAWHEQFPREDDRDGVGGWLHHGDPVFGNFVIVERASGQAVGTVGFFGPPDETGTVMVGYGLVEPARGRGYATEALRALVGYAARQSAAKRVVADTAKDNVPSQRVLEKAGFAKTHETDDAIWYALDL
jgi:RimJ/RimL family protein N-acetyltransferase